LAELSYRQPGLVLASRAPGASDRQIRDLQRDLRCLGYLRGGIDGKFGPGTQAAVEALQYDLLHNNGRGSDGAAPVALTAYNRGRVTGITGNADQNLVECISDILDDLAFPKLPRADDPAAENRRIAAELARLPSNVVPMAFLMAILKQESDLKHFHEPEAHDEDSYVQIGLDRNGTEKRAVTSRGYGVGQYTLFHHPPTPEEVSSFISDISGNIGRAVRELRSKFDGFVNGPASHADDRLTECGSGPLRLCKHRPGDPGYMTGCAGCLRDAGTRTVAVEPTQYYSTAAYHEVPVRSKFGCDWPYAVRRYNGSGPNSYHYQARVLQHLVEIEGRNS